MKPGALAAYGLLGLPLAMAMLPIYVLVPNFYTAELGLSLSVAGTVLFAARLVDTLQDPWLGRVIDRIHGTGWSWLLLVGGILLALALAGLLIPPAWTGTALACWLALLLILTYTAHSLVNITYLAWGARLSDHPDTRTQIAAWREGAGLIGVVLASVLPTVLAAKLGQAGALRVLVLVFAVALLLGVIVLLLSKTRPVRMSTVQAAPTDWRLPLRNPAFRRLAGVFFINAVAVSIPATLALFFIADRLQLAAQAGFFLAIYFVSGAAGLPLWTQIASRVGKARAWQIGMLAACAAFIWAMLLPAGAAWGYAAVCLLSGLALGADLALPPSMLADVIPAQQRDLTAAYFGWWSLLGKLALAMSGLALPLLAWLGYVPGMQAGWSLALVYAGVPCGLKLLAAGLIWLGGIDPSYRRKPVSSSDAD